MKILQETRGRLARLLDRIVMRKAPWPDYAGNDLFNGDKIRHPSGQMGVIVYRSERATDADKWLVNYGGYLESRLCLQIDDKGQAVKAA